MRKETMIDLQQALNKKSSRIVLSYFLTKTRFLIKNNNNNKGLRRFGVLSKILKLSPKLRT